MMEMFWITVQYSSSQLPTTIDVAIVLDSTGLEEQSKLVTVLSSL